jgi:hypothetical protein
MQSKIVFGSAILALVALAGIAEPASAWERALKGTRTRNEIKSTCAANGGSYTDSPADKSYGCSKGGNYVVCQYGSGKCKGGGKGKDPAARQLSADDVLGGKGDGMDAKTGDMSGGKAAGEKPKGVPAGRMPAQ